MNGPSTKTKRKCFAKARCSRPTWMAKMRADVPPPCRHSRHGRFDLGFGFVAGFGATTVMMSGMEGSGDLKIDVLK